MIAECEMYFYRYTNHLRTKLKGESFSWRFSFVACLLEFGLPEGLYASSFLLPAEFAGVDEADNLAFGGALYELLPAVLVYRVLHLPAQEGEAGTGMAGVLAECAHFHTCLL